MRLSGLCHVRTCWIFVNRLDGTWVVFTGDQLGALFAGRILAQYKASGKPLGRSRPFPLDAVPIARSGNKWDRKALHGGIHRELQDDRSYGSGRRIQLHRVSHWLVFVYMVKFTVIYCFLGFKYIGNTALTLVEQGYEVPFGYEEAIGFMIGSEIRDKDGVAAAVRTCPK